MIRVVVTAAVELSEVKRLVLHSIAVAIGKSGLPSIGAWKPAEEVVEGAVLHRYADDVVERWLFERRKIRVPAAERARPGQCGSGGNELPAGEALTHDLTLHTIDSDNSGEHAR